MFAAAKTPVATGPAANHNLREHTPFGGTEPTQITSNQTLYTSGLYTAVGLYDRAHNVIHVHVGKTAYGKTSQPDIEAVKQRAGGFSLELERAYPGVRISHAYIVPGAKPADLIRDPVKSGPIFPSGTATDRSKSEYISGKFRLAGYLIGDDVESPRIIVGIRDFPEGQVGDGNDISRLRQVAGYLIRDLKGSYPHHEIIDTTNQMNTNVYVGSFLAPQKF
jgi:hypothetical protein